MRQIKTYESYTGGEDLNESLLVLGGIAAAAFVLPSLVKSAKAAWNKKMLEMKYKPTGQIEKITIPGIRGKKEPVELPFKIYKDEDGNKFWALEVVDRATGDPGYEKAQIFLYDEKGINKLQNEGILSIDSQDVDDPHGIFSGYGLRAAHKWETDYKR